MNLMAHKAQNMSKRRPLHVKGLIYYFILTLLINLSLILHLFYLVGWYAFYYNEKKVYEN